MDNPFFNHPILNSPYEYPARHWEIDDSGQPTNRILDARRRVSFISPIPKPRKRRDAAAQQASLVFDEASRKLADGAQQYDLTAIINAVRRQVDVWRSLPNPAQWCVTPETARLLQHWRHHRFSGIRPFFCQVEAVETAIWLTEVAPHAGRAGRDFLDHLANASRDANPDLLQGRGEALAVQETEGQMLQRVMPELMGAKGILVLNDEAHHCYREKPGEDNEGNLKGDDRKGNRSDETL